MLARDAYALVYRGRGLRPLQRVRFVRAAHADGPGAADGAACFAAPKVCLVVNTAPRQCEQRTGHFGPGVKVLTVSGGYLQPEGLEDDPDARKAFDIG